MDIHDKHQILVVFDHKPHIIFIPVKSELTLLEIIKSIVSIPRYNELVENIDEYFFLINGSASFPDAQIPQDYKTYYLTCYRKQRGGGDITDIIGFIFQPIFAPIDAIFMVFVLIIKFIGWFFKFLGWFIQFVWWVLNDLLDPAKIVNDFYHGLVVIVYSIFGSALEIILAMVGYVINSLGGMIQNFWGWDNEFTTELDRNSDYLKRLNKNKNRKCYLTRTNTVPFSVLLGTILCPPVGVFMDMGMTGWLNILICIMLTLLFYFPGLAYALLIIYS